LLKEKHKKIILDHATKALTKELDKKLSPIKISILPQKRSISSSVSSYILNKIDEAIPQCNLTEFTGSNDEISAYIRDEPKRLVDDISPKLFDMAVDELKKELPLMKQQLAENRQPLESCDQSIKSLRNQIETNTVGRQPAWAGADVYIGATQRSDLEQRGFYSVITNDAVLAENISWVLRRLNQIMSPYLDHQIKYQYYGELAEAVDRKLKLGDVPTEDVLMAVIDASESLRNEWHELTLKHFDKQQSELEAIETFIDEHDREPLIQ
jgi:hypothetical protein